MGKSKMKQRVIFQAKPIRDEPYISIFHCKCSINVWLTHLSQGCAVNPHYSWILYLWSCQFIKIDFNSKINNRSAFVAAHRCMQNIEKSESPGTGSWLRLNTVWLCFIPSLILYKCPFLSLLGRSLASF